MLKMCVREEVMKLSFSCCGGNPGYLSSKEFRVRSGHGYNISGYERLLSESTWWLKAELWRKVESRAEYTPRPDDIIQGDPGLRNWPSESKIVSFFEHSSSLYTAQADNKSFKMNGYDPAIQLCTHNELLSNLLC